MIVLLWVIIQQHFWVPVPNQWCIGIRHQGKSNASKAKKRRKKRHKTGCVNKAELVHKAKCLHPEISSKLSATSSLCQTTSTNSANIHSMLNRIMSREHPPPPPKKPHSHYGCPQTGQRFKKLFVTSPTLPWVLLGRDTDSFWLYIYVSSFK